MNTQEIIKFVAGHFSRENGAPSIGFPDWLKIYRTWECNSSSISELDHHIPLRDAVVKLIYKEIYSLMPFDRDYVIKNYEHNLECVDYLLYPSKKATQLIVLLSGYSERKTYNRYSWFWDETELWVGETAFLFLNDTQNTWYCGHSEDKVDTYKSIIKKVSEQYAINSENVFMVGGSMGGYGAFRIGLELSVGGIISINPQTSIEAVSLHNDRAWYESIKKCGDKFIPVHELIDRHAPSKIYLECGKYCSDAFDLEAISVSAVRKGGLFILNHHSSKKHVTSSPNKTQLERVISLFSENVISNLTAENNSSSMGGTF